MSARYTALGFVIGLLALSGTTFAYYYGGLGGSSIFAGSSFGGYSYSNYGYSGGGYYPISYRSGYYSNPFGSYYGSGSFYGYSRSSAGLSFRSW